MSIQEWLDGKIGKVYRYKLEKMGYALDLLGHPEQSFDVIHVAGTNGKGSTVAFLQYLFQAHGYRVGTFTSPHMVTVQDRICINGLPIAVEDFEWIAREVQHLEIRVTEQFEPFQYFEVMVLIMLLYFSRQQLDMAVVEVGIGGLLDSTNVLTSRASVITSIGLDHEDLLGHTLEAIAEQKAGIVKAHIPVITGPLDKEARLVIEKIAAAKKAPLFAYGEDFCFENRRFVSSNWTIGNLSLGLKGQYQQENAAVALQVFQVMMEEKGWLIVEEQVRQALQAVRWPGRIEEVAQAPAIYLDGAHNVPAMVRLVEFIREFPQEKMTILFSALKRKDFHEMLEYLQREVPGARLVLTTFENGKDAVIDAQSGLEFAADIRIFIQNWRTSAEPDEVLFITGSLYFISAVRPLFTN